MIYTSTFDSTKFSNGAHTISAVACDAAGNCTTSAPVQFNINNPIPTPSVTPIVTPTPSITVVPTPVVSSNSINLLPEILVLVVVVIIAAVILIRGTK